MSQAGIISTTSGPVPPQVPTSFVTQNGTAVPAANILIVHGIDSTENNASGITAKGGVVGTGTSNEVDIVLTNRVRGTVTTANATPTTVISFALGVTPGVYTFSGDITAFDITDTAGASYGVISGIRTTGAAAIEIGTQFSTNFEEVAMTNADIDVTVSGNNVIFQVTGIAATTIDWDALFNYRFVS
jgi:hypothetical protein